MQKNSASNSITSSKSNSPITAIPSTPISPASYINSPSRCEIINTNIDVRTSRNNTQNSFASYEKDWVVSSNRFTSPIAHNVPAFLQPSVPISLDYNIQHQQHYHQRVATEFRPGMESAIDPH
uniref:Uncharacterized protein n=1 Tax=Meloidogyne hapla TaxID=6305 RepID=A0A1I8C0E5_MELHA